MRRQEISRDPHRDPGRPDLLNAPNPSTKRDPGRRDLLRSKSKHQSQEGPARKAPFRAPAELPEA